MSRRIDSHQHYWNPARGDYGWMPKDNPTLSRPYGPADLAPLLAKCGVEETVVVQAAPTVNETEYMLGLADATPSIAGVVGWVDFEDKADLRHLERLAQHKKLVSLRPMIQDIPDDGWMLRPEHEWAYAALTENGLAFDALGFPRHLENFHRLLNKWPDMRVVIDHCMKPQIKDHSEENFRFWAEGISRLARETGAFIKFSGIITESAENWSVADLAPYAAHVLEEFGAERVMWGSDWPVCRLRGEYDEWHGAARELTAELEDHEKNLVFGGTAAKFYGI